MSLKSLASITVLWRWGLYIPESKGPSRGRQKEKKKKSNVNPNQFCDHSSSKRLLPNFRHLLGCPTLPPLPESDNINETKNFALFSPALRSTLLMLRMEREVFSCLCLYNSISKSLEKMKLKIKHLGSKKPWSPNIWRLFKKFMKNTY